jgi:hypothetical protein
MSREESKSSDGSDFNEELKMEKKSSSSFNKVEEKPKEKLPLLADYVGVGCLWSHPIFEVLSHNYMSSVFDYCNESKDNKLSFEQFGKLSQDQKFDDVYDRLNDSWNEKEKELRLQPEEERDENAYFKNLLWCFRKELIV